MAGKTKKLFSRYQFIINKTGKRQTIEVEQDTKQEHVIKLLDWRWGLGGWRMSSLKKIAIVEEIK